MKNCILIKKNKLKKKFYQQFLVVRGLWNHVINSMLKKTGQKSSPPIFLVFSFFSFKLGFTPWKAEEPLQGTELQEKETQTD